MNERNIEDIIGALYDLVQDARSVPLAADKCIMDNRRKKDTNYVYDRFVFLDCL